MEKHVSFYIQHLKFQMDMSRHLIKDKIVATTMKVLYKRKHFAEEIFLSATWLSHDNIWPFWRGSLTNPILITAFCYLFDTKVTKSLVSRLGPKAQLSI